MKWCDLSPLPNLASKHLIMWGFICVDFYFSTFSALCPCISRTFFILPLSLTQFLPWSLLCLQLAPQKNDSLCQASQSAAAKTHLPCKYFTQSFFRSLYCHSYDGCPKFRIFSLLRLHSYIMKTSFLPHPPTSGQTISPLTCVWCCFLIHKITTWAPIPSLYSPLTSIASQRWPLSEIYPWPLGSQMF